MPPCPHFDLKIVQRSKRQSAVAAAAYQSGERLFSEYDQKQKYYCPQCRAGFRAFLRDKFQGDIDRLNRTYGTVFWSQQYNSFDEIPLPTPTITTHNPALRLDWERFRSDVIVRFAHFQASLLREILPHAVVIHDFPGGGLGKHADYSAVSRCLDVAAYNNYPVWGGQKEPLPPNEIAFGLDYIRGLKGENFWITEAIMGPRDRPGRCAAPP